MFSNLPPSPVTQTLNPANNLVYTTQDVNDALVGFFEEKTGSKDSAAALASAVLTGAQQQQIDVMVMLDQFKKLTGEELNSYVALFLNTTRVKTSLLGINNQPTAPYFVARTVLA